MGVMLRKITVVGSGTMGHGITYVAANAGYAVTMVDLDSAALERGMAGIRQLHERAISRGKLTSEAAAEGASRIGYSSDILESCRDADMVVEAIPEDIVLKSALFEQIDGVVRSNCILASNTSSLSIASLAGATTRPERFIGLHFFNPVAAMKLLEIVRGNLTSDATVEICRGFAESMGKTAIVVRDSPGFATSRLGVVLGLEAMRMFEQGVASAVDIDRAMELGYNHPVGPLKLSDLVGLDVRLAIAEHLFRTLGGAAYEPPQILRDLVAAGHLGKKSGRGFHTWDN